MSSDPGTTVPFPLDIGSSFAEEFLLHPDFRIIAGFLLGWVFWSGISNACRSQFFQLIGRIVWNFLRGPRSNPSELSDVEAQAAHNVEKKSQRRFSHLSAIHRISNEAALTFTLNLCFAFAGFAEFCSLLVYDRNGETACAFTIAWGSMAAQSARLIGLLMLVLRLNHRGVSNVEFYCLCAALVVGLSFVLAYTATNTGGVIRIQTLNTFLCNREPWVPTAILSSVGFIVLESYIIVRFLGWDAYRTGFKAMLAKSVNMQVGRGCSLLLLDVLTVVPNAATINQLVQFVPFSVAALIVLGVFNHDVQEQYAIPGSRVVTFAIPPVPTPLPTPRPTPHPPTSQGVVGSTMPTPQLNGYNNKDNSVIVFDSPEPPPAPIGRPSERRTLVVPTSAPPRIGDASVFAEHQTRQILPFQVQYAEQLERHLHTGPIVAPIRPKRQRPRVRVVIEDMEPPPSDSKAVPSIIGSDIIRMSSAATSDSKKQWSPGSNPTPTDYTVSRSGSSSVATPTTTIRTPTTTRDSTMSMLAPSHTRPVSSGSRMILSATSRQPSRRKIRSPGDTTSKLPWRSAPRTSFASAKTFGAREELPIVVEGQSSSGSRRTSRGSAMTKYAVIGRPHSLRGSGSASPQRSRFGKQLPSIPSDSRPSSSRHLAVPDSRRSTVGLPASPASSKSIRPSSEYIVRTPTTPKVSMPELPSPALPMSTLPMPSSPPPGGAYERAQGTGRLRGPRSPPISSSVPNLVSGWPVSELGLREERRRSSSYPALPPLTLGSASLQHAASIRR